MDHRAGCGDVAFPDRSIARPVRVQPPVVLEPCQPPPPDRINPFEVHQAAVPAVKKHIFRLESALLGRVDQVPEMVVLRLAVIRLVIDPVITRQVALAIGPEQRQQVDPLDHSMMLARPHVMDKVHLPRVRLVQDGVIQHQDPGVQPNLRLHLQPQGVVGWLKPVQQPGVRIMRGFNRTNRVGPLRLHRRRIHRGGDQKVDEVFSSDFWLGQSSQR